MNLYLPTSVNNLLCVHSSVSIKTSCSYDQHRTQPHVKTKSDKRHYLPLEKSSSISEVGGAMAAPPPAKYNAQISVIYVL